ncbi:MAG: chemotaxis protein MotB [Bdellovibrionales bacterium]|nr:chemotaxis protein MotB [Bdellovibrionales bacterium]
MAEKEPMIVIKKVTVNAAGHHGGAWKVAFADFMTALMAFFLVMWLVSQSEEVKKNVADYFSTPSIIEYNFSNYGVELTLEKLFLDLVNEPLKFFQTFIKPVDYTPNIMAMGSKKVVMHHIADQLSDTASNVQVQGNEIAFELEAKDLFVPGTARPTGQFVSLMEKVKGLTAGLEDSNVYVDSSMYKESVVGHSKDQAQMVLNERMDIVTKKVEIGLEHETVDIFARTKVMDYEKPIPKSQQAPDGKIKFRIKHKEFKSDGKKQRELKVMFGDGEENLDVYNNFINKLTNKERRPQSTNE